jgi:hypothetical protein
MQVVAFWTDAVQNQADKPKSTRGFGGRLYFYGKDPNKPVKVKGNLVVYAFDETNRDPKNVIPDKKYVFTPEQFQRKYSKSTLGDSYSVWLPWDEVGGPQRQVSLVARFTSEKGEMITSDEAHQLLPGTAPDKKAPAAGSANITLDGQSIGLPVVPPMPFGAVQAGQSGIQLAAYTEPLENGGAPKTFSVMQASTGAAVSQATAGQGAGPVPGPESYAVDPTVPRMRTTTISVPQMPRPRFTSPEMQSGPTAMNVQGAGFNSGMSAQPAGVNFGAMRNQLPMQNQIPVQMQPAMQMPMNSQGQAFVPGQLPIQKTPAQSQTYVGQNANPNFTGQTAFTGQAMPGQQNPAAMNPAVVNPMMMNRPAASGPGAPAGTATANAARSEFDKLRALGGPISRLDSDRGQWPPPHVEQPSTLPFAPQLAQQQ